MTPLWLMLSLLVSCCLLPASNNGRGGGAGHAEDAGDTMAITRWTDTHELFVELDTPVAGSRFAYQAQISRLADNRAATSGSLTIRFEQDGFAMESHTDESVARVGVFASEATAPQEPGRYLLMFGYRDGEERAAWEAAVTVAADTPEPHPAEPKGEVTFPKQTQWQIPFQVTPATLRSMAPSIAAAATVISAPTATTVVAAPVEGLLAWSNDLPVVGRRVQKGERLATLIPAGEAAHWSELQADLATAGVDEDLAVQELRRVEDLTARALLPERRLEEARAALERASAQVIASGRVLSALNSGGDGAVPIRAPANGLVVSVGADHGVAVPSGTPLVSVSSGASMLIEGRVHDRTRVALMPVSSLSVLRGDWSAPRDLLPVGGRLLTEQLVFDAATLSAPVAVLVEHDIGLVPGDLVELRVGVGDPVQRLAVPHEAVVEINGQDVLFVQKTGESFTRRRVTVGAKDATHVEIRSGLQAGERVVVKGGFDVHVASLSGALESHRH